MRNVGVEVTYVMWTGIKRIPKTLLEKIAGVATFRLSSLSSAILPQSFVTRKIAELPGAR